MRNRLLRNWVGRRRSHEQSAASVERHGPSLRGPGIDELAEVVDAEANGLADADWFELAAAHEMVKAGRSRKYPRGSLVFSEGDDAHEVLIVRSGRVKVVAVAPNGREVVLNVLDDGSVLGELSAVDGGPRSATVIALEPTEVLVLAHAAFQALLASNAEIARAIVGVIASRLRAADRRQLEFGSNDAIGRVCHRLLDLRERYGKPQTDGRVMVELPFSQTDLANWAGLSREAVVKGLRSLRLLGWIELDGRTVTILNDAAIRDRSIQ